jgi:hypothetical protein
MTRHDTYVGFDLDGVLADCTRMAEAISKRTGLQARIEDWTSYNFCDRYGLSSAEFLDLLVDEKVLERAVPVPGIRQAMDTLHQHGLKIVVVTARAFHPDGDNVTRNWLEEHGIPADRLALVHHHETKVDALRQVPGLLCYVDDYLVHLHTLARAAVTDNLFVMDQPWNRHDQTFNRTLTLVDYVERAAALARQIPLATPTMGALRGPRGLP